MKRTICILLAILLCTAAFSPLTAFAATYPLEQTDLTISIDDSTWYIFTRENITDNPELDELGISYDEIHKILYDNNAYMDAILYYEDGEYVELIVRKKPLDSGVAQLSNYENDEVLELAKELGEQQGTKEYSVYENQYKFAKLEYLDTTYNYYICEYLTIVNKDNYTFTFQSPVAYTDFEREEMKSIIDSIHFDVDTTLKEERSSSFWSTVATRAIIGAIGGGLVGGVIVLINKKKKKRTPVTEAPAEAPWEME